MKRHLIVILLCLFSLIWQPYLTAQGSSIDDLTWVRGTFFGQANNTGYLLDVAVDAQGYVYGTGWCTHIQATPNAYRSVGAGRNDIMVFKMDPTLQQVIWATYIGGSNDEAGGSIAVNAQGEVFVSGYTLSANFPVVNGVGANYLKDEYTAAFVLKLSADGSQLLYSSILGLVQAPVKGLELASKGAVMTINPQGEAFVATQSAASGSVTVTNNAYSRFINGKNDLVYAKLSQTGAILYSTFFGGIFDESVASIIWANNKIYIAGVTASANLPFQSGKPVDIGDCFVMVADDQGNNVPPRRSFVFGSGNLDASYAMTYDPMKGRLIFAGTALSTNMPYTTVLQQNQISGGFVCSLDTALQSLGFCTMLGVRVTPRSVAVNTNGKVYVGAWVTTGGSIALTPNAFQSSLQGSFDAALFCLDSTGAQLRYGTYIGGKAEDYSAVTVQLAHSGCFLRVIVGLTTHSPNFPSTTDAFQDLKLNGDEDQPALELFTTLEDLTVFQSVKICQREVTLSIGGNCRPIKIFWDFGDGNYDSVSGANARHVYARPGTYYARAKMTYAEPDTIVAVRLVTIDPGPQIDAGEDKVVCSNNSLVQLRATNSLKVQWSPAAAFDNPTSITPFVHPSVTTTYYCKGIDANGCESYDSVTVYVNVAKAIVPPDTTVCAGQSILLHASGGLFVEWSPKTDLTLLTESDVIATPKKKTRYQVVVTNGNCTDTAWVTINVKPIAVLGMPQAQTICAGHAVELRPNVVYPQGADPSAYRYRWTPNYAIDDTTHLRPFVAPKQNTTYYLDVISPDGCINHDSVKIIMKVSNVVTVIGDTGLCKGESIYLWSRGAVTTEWSPPDGLDNPLVASPLCTPSQTTTYQLVTFNGFCIDTQFVRVVVGEKPVVKLNNDTTVCSMETVQLRVLVPQSGVRYQWFPASDFVMAEGAVVYLNTPTSKTYHLIATSGSSCIVEDSVRVNIDSSLKINGGADQSLCQGEICTIAVSGANVPGLNISMQPPLATFDTLRQELRFPALNSQRYIIHAWRGTCVSDDTVDVQVRPGPVLLAISADTVLCTGQSLQLDLSLQQSGANISWLRNGQLDTLLDNPRDAHPRSRALDTSTVFEVDIEQQGCTIHRRVAVEVQSPPTLSSSQNLSVCRGDSVRYQVLSSPGVRAQWSPAVGISSDTALNVQFFPDVNTNYTLELRTKAGCTSIYGLTCSVLPRQNIDLQIDPMQVMAGENCEIVIHAHTTISTTQDLHCVVQYPATLFKADNATVDSTVGGMSSINLRFSSLKLGPNDTVIARIPGLALLAMERLGPLRIKADASPFNGCVAARSHNASIDVRSCFDSGRNILFVDTLLAAIQPQPVGNEATLQIQSEELELVHCQLFDALGQIRSDFIVHHDQLLTKHPLNLQDLSSGLYTLRLSSSMHSTTINLLKAGD